MNANKVSPRIYVADLAAYNAGILHGRWIDATLDADDIQEQVEEMLAASPVPGAEEWAIHDHEGLGDIGEGESFERVSSIGQAIADASEPAALLAWLSAEPGRDPGDFDDFFRGSWHTLADYVQEMFCDYDADEAAAGQWFHPARYVDWDRMARDLELSGDVETIRHPGGLWVFSN